MGTLEIYMMMKIIVVVMIAVNDGDDGL